MTMIQLSEKPEWKELPKAVQFYIMMFKDMAAEHGWEDYKLPQINSLIDAAYDFYNISAKDIEKFINKPK